MPKDAESEPVGAATPCTVTHGFSLSDPSLMWLILHAPTYAAKGDSKIVENRDFRMQPG